MKRCARCKELKPIDCFNKNSQQKDGLHVYCRLCIKVYAKKHYGEHREERIEKERQRRLIDPEKFKKYGRSYRANFSDKIRAQKIKKLYGIDFEDWVALFESQDKKCAICKMSEPGIKGWQTDHNHETKEVRGILCTSCNNGLGRFKDNPGVLLRAADYLRNHEFTRFEENHS
jgi:hypothetical protein